MNPTMPSSPTEPGAARARRALVVPDAPVEEEVVAALLQEGAAVVVVTDDPGRWARFARDREPTEPIAILAGEPSHPGAIEVGKEMAQDLFGASSVEVAERVIPG